MLPQNKNDAPACLLTTLPEPRASKWAARIPLSTASVPLVGRPSWKTFGRIFATACAVSLKTPGFTIIALLSLALGIGGNSAIFTLINQVLLRNLPVRAPEQLVTFGRNNGSGVVGGVDLGFNGLFPWYFAQRLQSAPGPFQGIAAYGSFSDKVSIHPPSANGLADASSSAILAPATLVSGNYFDVLGAHALMGRTISVADDSVPGTGAVVVLSHHFWQQSLSADPAILGKTLTINGTPFAIIGVMPQKFHGLKEDLEPAGLWTPISMQSVVWKQPSLLTANDGAYFLDVFGRLSDAALHNKQALAQSQNWLDQQIRTDIRAHEGAKLTTERQQEIARISVPLTSATRGVSSLRNRYGDSLMILMCAVGLVLLIACANLANFLLARAATRRREIATRLALGSTRKRIVRQSLIETFLLSFTGGLLGLGVAFSASRALIAFVSKGNSYVAMNPTPDATVLLFTLGVCLVTGLLFGLAPAVVAARTSAVGNLNSGSRTAQSAGGRSARFWPKALVTAQVMLSLLLLVGAGLFLRTLRNLQNQDYGFERTHLLIANFNARLAGYKPIQAATLQEQLVARLSALPGVQSAALALTPPISGGNWSSSFQVAGYKPAPKENLTSALNRVSGKYFETAGISIIAGRPLSVTDTRNGQKVAVINQAVANHFFPKGNAVGHTLTIDSDDVKGPWQIVGIARDTKERGPRETEPQRMIYLPLAQIEQFNPVDPAAPAGTVPEENQSLFAGLILLRTAGDPAHAISDLRSVVNSIDPNLPLTHIATIGEAVDEFMSHDQLISTLTGLFALLALLLAAIGLYGVMSYNVVRRTNEIGIRIALGAQKSVVQWMVLGESLLLLAIGVGVGLPLTYAATREIQGQLYGLSALDPLTFSIALVVVSAMTLLAAWLPARRASRVDPMVALRCE